MIARYIIIYLAILLGIAYTKAHTAHFNYILNKSEYNELRQDGKVWAYVRKDGKL